MDAATSRFSFRNQILFKCALFPQTNLLTKPVLLKSIQVDFSLYTLTLCSVLIIKILIRGLGRRMI